MEYQNSCVEPTARYLYFEKRSLFCYSRLPEEVFNTMLDEYYDANGWSLDTSVPKAKTLEALGLGDVVGKLRESGVDVES